MPIEEKRVIIGRIGTAYGVQGWVKVNSFTVPVTNLLEYNPLNLFINNEWLLYKVENGKTHGSSIVIKLEGCDDRTATRFYTNALIAVERERLPNLVPGEYYWTDLENLRVITNEGVELGIISSLFSTGSNDVMVVKGEKEYLIPYLPKQVIINVDLPNKIMTVDWDVNF